MLVQLDKHLWVETLDLMLIESIYRWVYPNGYCSYDSEASGHGGPPLEK